MIITVTPVSGDPDIYASTTQTQPSYSDYMWSSNDVGADSIVINPSDEGFVGPGYYYISIYGYNDQATFWIVASSTDVVTDVAPCPLSSALLPALLVAFLPLVMEMRLVAEQYGGCDIVERCSPNWVSSNWMGRKVTSSHRVLAAIHPPNNTCS